MATDLFLSHDWGADGKTNHAKVTKINEALKKLGYVTWFDNERMVGNIREQMADGIENTKCFVAFITERYHDKVVDGAFNDNCKLEFDYACDKVPAIAVVLDASMRNTQKWKGNVGISLKSKMYVDMSGDIDDEGYLSCQLMALVKELSAIGIASIVMNGKLKQQNHPSTQCSESQSSDTVDGSLPEIPKEAPVPKPRPTYLPYSKQSDSSLNGVATSPGAPTPTPRPPSRKTSEVSNNPPETPPLQSSLPPPTLPRPPSRKSSEASDISSNYVALISALESSLLSPSKPLLQSIKSSGASENDKLNSVQEETLPTPSPDNSPNAAPTTTPDASPLSQPSSATSFKRKLSRATPTPNPSRTTLHMFYSVSGSGSIPSPPLHRTQSEPPQIQMPPHPSSLNSVSSSSSHLCKAAAEIFIFESKQKKWIHAGDINEPGLSCCTIYYDDQQEDYVITGNKLNRKDEIVLNKRLGDGRLEQYEQLTETFHRMKLEGEIFSLKFENAEDAKDFSEIVSRIQTLTSDPDWKRIIAITGHLSDAETMEFVFDFVESHGGITKAIEEIGQGL